MNLASALTDGFAEYTNIDQDTINLGNQLLFLATVALEIPSNMLLQKVRTSESLPHPSYYEQHPLTPLQPDRPPKMDLNPGPPLRLRRHHADLHPQPSRLPRLPLVSGPRRVRVHTGFAVYHLDVVHAQGEGATGRRLLLWHVWRERAESAFGVWDSQAGWCWGVKGVAVVVFA